MRIFLMTCLICLSPLFKVLAEVPHEMMYQVMVINPSTGLIEANKKVDISIELREESAAGKIAWQHDFNVTTDEAGMCDLVLNFDRDIKWDDGPYFIRVIIDGENAGYSKIASVPYALTAATVEGVVPLSFLYGTWETESEYNSGSERGTITDRLTFEMGETEDEIIVTYTTQNHYHVNTGDGVHEGINERVGEGKFYKFLNTIAGHFMDMSSGGYELTTSYSHMLLVKKDDYLYINGRKFSRK